jgi:PAS domain S-box-containing protein
MALNYRSATAIVAGIFIFIVGYILFVQNTLIELYKIPHALTEFEKQVSFWSGISISVALLLSLSMLIAFFVIISSRLKEAESHQKLENLYIENRLYFENAAVGFLITDSQRRILNVNPMFCSMTGYSKDELIGRSTSIFHIDEEHNQRWNREVLKKVKRKEVHRIRYPMRKKDGASIYVEVSGASFDASHQLYEGGVVWSITDISRNVGREEIIDTLNKELENSVSYFKNLLAIAPMPIFVKDETLRYTECNTAFLNLFNAERSEVIGHPTQAFLTMEMAEVIDDNDEALMQMQESHYSKRIDVAHSVFVLEIHKAPIIFEGHFRGIVGIAVDVTRLEQKQLYLNRRVEEEMLKNKAQQKQHLEESMNNARFTAIGQLSAGITHEINTPLTYMKGNVEMMGYDIDDLEAGTLKQSLVEGKQKILEGIGRIESIISSMREVAHQGSQDITRVNICKTLTTALVMAQNRFKHIVRVRFQGEDFETPIKNEDRFIFEVMAQAQRLEQAWIIIINNALDELEHKGSFDQNRFEIECDQDDTNVKIAFRDNGGGIDESILDKMFEPFVSNKRHGGIGIGLNITHKIIKDHHGHIRAYNRDNGAVIEVTLPLAS